MKDLASVVIASEAKQSITQQAVTNGLLRRFAPRNDGLDAPHASASRPRARSKSPTMMVMLSAFQASPFMNAAA